MNINFGKNNFFAFNLNIDKNNNFPLKKNDKPRKSFLIHHNIETNTRFKISNNTDNYLSISFVELLCDRICQRKSRRIELLDKAESYINEKISIEFLLKKLNEIDKLKFSLLDSTQLQVFHIIPNPNFNEIFSLNNSKIISLIDNLWSKYEFYQRNDKEEVFALLQIKDPSREKDKISERLINLTAEI